MRQKLVCRDSKSFEALWMCLGRSLRDIVERSRGLTSWIRLRALVYVVCWKEWRLAIGVHSCSVVDSEEEVLFSVPGGERLSGRLGHVGEKLHSVVLIIERGWGGGKASVVWSEMGSSVHGRWKQKELLEVRAVLLEHVSWGGERGVWKRWEPTLTMLARGQRKRVSYLGGGSTESISQARDCGSVMEFEVEGAGFEVGKPVVLLKAMEVGDPLGHMGMILPLDGFASAECSLCHNSPTKLLWRRPLGKSSPLCSLFSLGKWDFSYFSTLSGLDGAIVTTVRGSDWGCVSEDLGAGEEVIDDLLERAIQESLHRNADGGVRREILTLFERMKERKDQKGKLDGRKRKKLELSRFERELRKLECTVNYIGGGEEKGATFSSLGEDSNAFLNVRGANDNDKRKLKSGEIWTQGMLLECVLLRPMSDHFSILLDGGGLRRGPSPFRFENMWLKVEEGFGSEPGGLWDAKEKTSTLSLEELEARKK
ncbi:hypothetical protein CK203_061333 [Vitis vinifera]|uniref:DUF4283 domain-containing protein n=1 Tax=Vitis vinifera TaxID=29760 RepID=A0A438GHN7_VITVI|nr:hypothetical protein CK203_061333 [Vitis vinifera]